MYDNFYFSCFILIAFDINGLHCVTLNLFLPLFLFIFSYFFFYLLIICLVNLCLNTKAYERKDEKSLQPAILMLMISVKVRFLTLPNLTYSVVSIEDSEALKTPKSYDYSTLGPFTNFKLHAF